MNALDDLLLRRYRESIEGNRRRPDAEVNRSELPAASTAEDCSEPQPLEAIQSDSDATEEPNINTEEPHINMVHEAFAELLERFEDTETTEDTEGTLADASSELVDEEQLGSSDVIKLDAGNESLAFELTDAHEQETQEIDDSIAMPMSEQHIEEPRMPFKPDWEVDHFLWPSICTDVEQRLKTELASVLETIQADCQSHLCNVLTIASTDPGSGSTTMALCLAREAARQGLSVALVDLHHARPTIADRLGVACDQGIESLPLESVEPHNICIAAIEDGISIVPLTRPVDSEFCGSANIQELINEVATEHDLVLVDTSSEVIRVMIEQNQCRGFGAIWVSAAQDDQDVDSSITLPISLPLSDQRDDIWTVGVIRNQAA